MKNIHKLILLVGLAFTANPSIGGTTTGFILGSMMNGSGKQVEQVMTFSYNPSNTIRCAKYEEVTNVCALDKNSSGKHPLPNKYKPLPKCPGYQVCYSLDHVVQHMAQKKIYTITKITRFSKYTLPVYIEIE